MSDSFPIATGAVPPTSSAASASIDPHPAAFIKMIAFRVRGRTVSVLCAGLDPATADIQLNVVLDHRGNLDAGHVVSVEAGQARQRWRVNLPTELYEGQAHHIGLQ